ncbi:hypothetical protein PMAYCL1PPCAC_09939, partial [Pristionchus mayeri]
RERERGIERRGVKGTALSRIEEWQRPPRFPTLTNPLEQSKSTRVFLFVNMTIFTACLEKKDAQESTAKLNPKLEDVESGLKDNNRQQSSKSSSQSDGKVSENQTAIEKVTKELAHKEAKL